jgi:hypothetical protein
VGHALVVRYHEADAAVGVEPADDGSGAALQDLDDGALQPPAPVLPRDAGDDAVAVEDGPHLFGIEVEVVAALVRLHEAEAVRVGDDAPGDEVALVHQAVGVAAIAHQLPVADHGAQASLKGGEVLLAVRTRRRRPPGTHRRRVRGERFEDELATWDGVVVLLGFALAMGILRLWRIGSICVVPRVTCQCLKLASVALTPFRCLTIFASFAAPDGRRLTPPPAEVAELVDAHGSGPCLGNQVEVQVLSSAPSQTSSPSTP